MTKELDIWHHRKRKRRKLSSASSSSKVVAPNGETRPWHELCTDLLYEIATRLSYKDFIHLTAVCKHWHSIPQPPRPNARSMLLMLHRMYDGACKLIDPARNIAYNVDFPEIACTTILASRAGWLLLKRLDGVFFYLPPARRDKTGPDLFFFCPATRDQISLPTLDERLTRSDYYAAAFSSSPVSSDCVTVIVNAVHSYMKVFVWHSGDDGWGVHWFQNPAEISPFNLFACSHLFYCQGFNDIIGVFDSKLNTWRVFGTIKGLHYVNRTENMSHHFPSKEGMTDYILYDVRLTEFEGQLYLVCTGGRWKPFRVKVDSSTMMLEKEVENLEGCTVCVGPRMVDMVAPQDGVMANKIYFPMTMGRSEKCVYYYLATDRYYPKLQFSMPSKLSVMLKEEKVGRVWIEGDKIKQHVLSSLEQEPSR